MVESVIKKDIVSVTTCKCGSILLYDVVNIDGRLFHRFHCVNNVDNHYKPFDIGQARSKKEVIPLKLKKVDFVDVVDSWKKEVK